jgi:hypothetical protein
VELDALLIAETKQIDMGKLKEILVPYGVRKKLKDSTGHAECTIRFALKGFSDTESAKLIRKRAMEMGGVMVKN